MTTESPSSKRAKTAPSKGSDLLKVAEEAWEHYRNYVESVQPPPQEDMFDEGEGVGGDEDELHEILNRVLDPAMSKRSIVPLRSFSELTTGKSTSKAAAKATRAVPIHSMLPILISVAYYHLADVAIAECLEHQEQDDKKNEDGPTPKSKQELISQCQHLIEQSLHWYPENAAMWSMGANFGRMLQVLKPSIICQWYEKAAECAVQVQQSALAFLEDDDDEEAAGAKDKDGAANPAKEWVELLLLNQVCAIDYILDDEDEEEDEVKEEQKKNPGKPKTAKEVDLADEVHDEDEKGYFSSSAVEATSRFMAAMLLSTTGKQDQALGHLKRFPLTHRVHPLVWQPPNTKPSLPDMKQPSVVKYKAESGAETGILPTSLYQHICKVFAPKASYWTESDYNHRGYYSYFMDKPQAKDEDQFVVTNVLDDVIWNHLYPIVNKQQEQQHQSREGKEEICGAEWWVHTRPVQANLGHNMHFDTDEALLAQEAQITHPLYSSVLYLTGGSSGGGATIILDQTPESKQVASKVWRCSPQDNTYVVFPGNLLHGVLPCPGTSDDSEDESSTTPCSAETIPKQWERKDTPTADGGDDKPHRLTLLVGFWTRRVPDKMKNRKLYGPCGPIPPRPRQEPAKKEPNDDEEEMEHTWVDQIHEGYDSKFKRQAANATTTASLTVIAPAWETINEDEKTSGGAHDADEKDGKSLEIPKPIDHRFFVRNAPQCFRESLFERDEDDEEEDYVVEMVEMEQIDEDED